MKFKKGQKIKVIKFIAENEHDEDHDKTGERGVIFKVSRDAVYPIYVRLDNNNNRITQFSIKEIQLLTSKTADLKKRLLQ